MTRSEHRPTRPQEAVDHQRWETATRAAVAGGAEGDVRAFTGNICSISHWCVVAVVGSERRRRAFGASEEGSDGAAET